MSSASPAGRVLVGSPWFRGQCRDGLKGSRRTTRVDFTVGSRVYLRMHSAPMLAFRFVKRTEILRQFDVRKEGIGCDISLDCDGVCSCGIDWHIWKHVAGPGASGDDYIGCWDSMGVFRVPIGVSDALDMSTSVVDRVDMRANLDFRALFLCKFCHRGRKFVWMDLCGRIQIVY